LKKNARNAIRFVSTSFRLRVPSLSWQTIVSKSEKNGNVKEGVFLPHQAPRCSSKPVKNVPFLNFSYVCPESCLGKKMIFGIKWRKKGALFAPSPSPGCCNAATSSAHCVPVFEPFDI
jgi:hypothetical protein